MYIVIAGAGVVGGTLARMLTQNRHDVVVVEQDREVCEQMSTRYDVLAIHGTATNIEVLDEAGMSKADVAVGALARDADNLAFTVLARNFQVPRIIARMRDPRYETAYKLAGVSRTIAVGDLFVSQLALEIEQPTLRQVAAFGRGKACIVVAVIPEGAAVDGKSVSEIGQSEAFPQDCVLAGIYREATEEFIIPRGKAQIRSGDQVFLAANTKTVGRAAAFLQQTR